MKFYVYIYYCPIRNEPIYVGSGTVKLKRAEDHLRRKDIHPLTHRILWIRKSGSEPLIEKILCESREEASIREIYLIDRFGRKDKGAGSLLNLTDGAEGLNGHLFSNEHKNKISNALKGKPKTKVHCANLSIAQKNKSPPSTETREKFRQAIANRSPELLQRIAKINTGKKRNAEQRERIRLGQIGRKHPGIGGVPKGTKPWNAGLTKEEQLEHKRLVAERKKLK